MRAAELGVMIGQVARAETMLIVYSLIAGFAALWLHEESQSTLDTAKSDLYNRLKWQCFGMFLSLGFLHFLGRN